MTSNVSTKLLLIICSYSYYHSSCMPIINSNTAARLGSIQHFHTLDTPRKFLLNRVPLILSYYMDQGYMIQYLVRGKLLILITSITIAY